MTKPNCRRLALTAFALLALVLGARTATAGTGAVTRHQVPGYATSLSAPAEWKAVSRAQAADPIFAARIGKADPGHRTWLDTRAMQGSEVRLLLFGNTGTPSQVMLGVSATTMPGVTLKEFEREMASEYRGQCKNMAQQSVVLPTAGHALRVTCTVKYGGITIYAQSYAFLRERKAIIVTLSSHNDQRARYARQFQAIGNSIRLG